MKPLFRYVNRRMFLGNSRFSSCRVTYGFTVDLAQLKLASWGIFMPQLISNAFFIIYTILDTLHNSGSFFQGSRRSFETRPICSNRLMLSRWSSTTSHYIWRYLSTSNSDPRYWFRIIWSHFRNGSCFCQRALAEVHWLLFSMITQLISSLKGRFDY